MLTPEEIKKRKLQEYLMQRQQASDMQTMYGMQEQARQLDEIKTQLKAAMSQLLGKEAMQRLMILRGTKPEFALQVELMLIELYKQGKLKPPLTDKQFKGILLQVTEGKKETKIRRK